MKFLLNIIRIIFLFWPGFLLLISGSPMFISGGSKKTELLATDSVKLYFFDGEFRKAAKLIDKLESESDKKNAREFEIFRAKMERIRLDFSKTASEIRKELRPWFPGITDEQMEAWEKSKALEVKIIDGEKRYFKNAVPNLFRLDPAARAAKVKKGDSSPGPLQIFRLQDITELITDYNKGTNLIQKKYNFKIDFTIALKPDAIPEGKTVKCWMPFPKYSPPRQDSVTLSEANRDFIVADKTAPQRSLFMEGITRKDKSLVFSYSAEFRTSPEYREIKPELVQPYDTASAVYKEHTKERPPHIVFSERIKNLANKITGGEINPYLKVRKIYYWIDENIPWASALEYSTFESIPEYVLENRHGDCGMQTLLFMSLARASGIPCKWQSGWMLHPGEVNLHDWCEVYYEGIGWVPLDISFSLQDSDNIQVKEFYITGIDGYRLIINDDFSREFTPVKKFFRSEPVDFQRGELEWEGGNIYFDKWSYHMKVTYHDEKK